MQKTMVKGEDVKIVRADWQVAALKAEGWVVEGEETVEENKPRRGRPPKALQEAVEE